MVLFLFIVALITVTWVSFIIYSYSRGSKATHTCLRHARGSQFQFVLWKVYLQPRPEEAKNSCPPLPLATPAFLLIPPPQSSPKTR